jgi:hypothetical protein
VKRLGKRYPLVLYTRMMDRWWPALFCIGSALGATAWPFYSDMYTRLTQPWRWITLATTGGVVILSSMVLLALRKSAYVQPFGEYLRLVTPFLRLNISYRRIQKTTSAGMATLFPPKTLRGAKREIAQPLLNRTAVVIDFSALPVPASTLRMFLSPFFFKDSSPHLVILVDNWMGFSTELESLRTGGDAAPPATERVAPSILARLPRK